MQRTYTIREVALLTGLPASTLRYYETIGVTPAIHRGETSGHRIYTQDDLDTLTWVACLAATGMPVEHMRAYVENGALGPDAASQQIELLRQQDARLAERERHLAVQRRYVDLKIAYWTAVQAGDTAGAEALAEQAASLSGELKRAPIE